MKEIQTVKRVYEVGDVFINPRLVYYLLIEKLRDNIFRALSCNDSIFSNSHIKDSEAFEITEVDLDYDDLKYVEKSECDDIRKHFNSFITMLNNIKEAHLK